MTSQAATVPATRGDAKLLPALALMRFIAVAGVIWTHACGQIKWMGSGFDFADAGRFGSAFFTHCSVFLVMLKAFGRDDLSFTQNVTGRFKRVYVPFLLWSMIYAINVDLRFRFRCFGFRISRLARLTVGLAPFFIGSAYDTL